jgi:hypothetical protein
MKPSDWPEILDYPVSFHPVFFKLTGSITAALMLSQAFYWTKRTKDADGWFYKTREEWQDEICLTRAEQETARRDLRATGFWEEQRRGTPGKMYYRINLELFNKALGGDNSHNAEKSPSDDNGRKAASSTAGKQPTSRARTITTETTQRERTHARKKPLRDPTTVEKTLCPSEEPTGDMHAWAEAAGYSSEIVETATAQWYRKRRSTSAYKTAEEWFFDWQGFVTIYMKNEKESSRLRSVQATGRPSFMAAEKRIVGYEEGTNFPIFEDVK